MKTARIHAAFLILIVTSMGCIAPTLSAQNAQLMVNPSSLSFTYAGGGIIPDPQSVAITSPAGISFTVSTNVMGLTNWLTATVNGSTKGTSPAVLSVAVSPLQLASGPYSGTIILQPSDGTMVTIPVLLTVQGSVALSVSPGSMSFTGAVGNTPLLPQGFLVNGTTQGLPFSLKVATANGVPWISLDAMSGSTPLAVHVTVDPTGLAVGTYYGTITITGTGAAQSTTLLPVMLTLTSTAPAVTSLTSAASFVTGMISPGEIVSLFGSNLGPSSPAGTALDENGQVSTRLSAVQVLFNGVAAPLTYVSATQINAVVPYEVSASGAVNVVVQYQSQVSNQLTMGAAPASPAIFTLSGGTGQAAALNPDNTLNGTGSGFTPAAAGSTVQVFVTGEGQVSPAAGTGSVTCAKGCLNAAQIPRPMLPVTALINGQPAAIAFYGEAPGDVSGVMQVNVTIPPGTASGMATLQIQVGGIATQPGVILAVK